MRNLVLVGLALVGVACARPVQAPILIARPADIASAPTDTTCGGRFAVRAPRPLFVVDGKLQSCDDLRTSFAATQPADIVSVEVVKNHKTLALYGSNIPGGVILIKTRKKP